MNTATVGRDWHAANQLHLTAALAAVRARLEAHARGDRSPASPETPAEAAEAAGPWALDTLAAAFGLSLFERDLLLVCAGVELDAAFGQLCADAQGDPIRAEPTFGLALAALRGAHWSALTPAAPLRYWRLVELGPGPGLTRSPLRIDERVLHHLVGLDHLDERLAGLVTACRAGPAEVPSQREAAERAAAAWASDARGEFPLIQFCGPDPAGRLAAAVSACEAAGVRPYTLAAELLPANPTDLDTLVRLWDREAVLTDAALVLDLDLLDGADPARLGGVMRFVTRARGPLMVSSAEPRRLGRPARTFEVARPAVAEQRALWASALGPAAAALNGQVDGLAAQFNLGATAIGSAAAEALGRPPAELGPALWDACRRQARPRMDELAQRIEPAATWDDLVLPESQTAALRDVVTHVRGRATVYEAWGFGARSARGLGITALFSGGSGTGKTLAAEVLARELSLDLYKIDLSQVVSKYIGETEKSLRRVFDAAECGGAVLLFDEADALFGKRSEVRDSHDRYANIEVSYLLQRMEAYRGLAVLTTNLKDALDPAFLRRLRFVVTFPFPDAAQREAIWRRAFPSATPTEGLDPRRLARLNVAGGSIRNMALGAAFLAAAEGRPVRMADLLRAARGEYDKLEKSLAECEVEGWV